MPVYAGITPFAAMALHPLDRSEHAMTMPAPPIARREIGSCSARQITNA